MRRFFPHIFAVTLSISIQSHSVFPFRHPFLLASPPATLRTPLPVNVSLLLSSLFHPPPLLWPHPLPLIARLEEPNAGIPDLMSNFKKCHKNAIRLLESALGGWRLLTDTQGLKEPWLGGSSRNPVSWVSPAEGGSLSAWALGSTRSPGLGLRPPSFLWKAHVHFLASLVPYFLFNSGHEVRVSVVIFLSTSVCTVETST